MAINYTNLASEINLNPRGYGFAPYVTAKNDQAIADLLNTVRDGTNPPSNPTAASGTANGAISVKRANITSKELYESIDVSDYTSLPTNPSNTQLSNERRYLAWFTGLAAIPEVRLLNDDGSNGPVVNNLQVMFPLGTATRTRLLNIATRNASRAEELFGTNTTIVASDVSFCLRGTK